MAGNVITESNRICTELRAGRSVVGNRAAVDTVRYSMAFYLGRDRAVETADYTETDCRYYVGSRSDNPWLR